MYSKTVFFILILYIQSCCDPSMNYDENIPTKNNKGYLVIIQSKNINSDYFNVKTYTVEWLGTNNFQIVNNDTISYLSIDIKNNQTKFKINHQLGIDTIVFNYNWEQMKHKVGCTYNKIERNQYNFRAISNKGSVKDSIGIFFFKIN
jgi:hypothetical protein